MFNLIPAIIIMSAIVTVALKMFLDLTIIQSIIIFIISLLVFSLVSYFALSGMSGLRDKFNKRKESDPEKAL